MTKASKFYYKGMIEGVSLLFQVLDVTLRQPCEAYFCTFRCVESPCNFLYKKMKIMFHELMMVLLIIVHCMWCLLRPYYYNKCVFRACYCGA